jgi:hypothetical protein
MNKYGNRFRLGNYLITVITPKKSESADIWFIDHLRTGSGAEVWFSPPLVKFQLIPTISNYEIFTDYEFLNVCIRTYS